MSTVSDNSDGDSTTRQERREKRRLREKRRQAKHGASLIRVYRDAIVKRLGRLKGRGKE